MPQVAPPIFNKRATERLHSPDDLDRYVRVTNPSVWAILGAIVALLAGLFAWGVFGAVTKSVNATATCVNGRVVCFLDADDAAQVHVGDEANVAGARMEIAEIATVPMSLDEAATILGSDYLVDTLIEGNWAYMVSFDGDVSSLREGIPLSATITNERIAPIELVLGGGA